MEYEDGYEDDYNSHSSSSGGFDDGYDDFASQGFSIEDSADFNDESSMADDWLAKQEGDLPSEDAAVGGATAATLLQGRLEGLGDSTKRAFRDTLLGSVNLDRYNISPSEYKNSVAEFGTTVGEDPKEFASRIKVEEATPITHTTAMGRELKVPRTIQPQHTASDMRVVMSMLGQTSGSYLDEGPGLKLQGNNPSNAKREIEQHQALDTALDYIAEISDLYIRDETKKNTTAYKQRFYEVNEAITERLLQGHFRRPDAGGPDKSLLPTPNDVYGGSRRVTGLVPTVNNMGMSTALTYKDYTMLREDGTDYKKMPNIGKSLFPKSDWQDRKNLVEDLFEKADFASNVLRTQLPTNRDDSARQKRHGAWDTPYGDQAVQGNLFNEAAILDLDINQPALPELSDKDIKAHGRGQSSGGMYGEKGLSERERFVRERSNELGSDEDPEFPVDADPAAVYADTDLGRYQERIKGTAAHKQGSEEWKAQREGKVTASTADLLLSKNPDKAMSVLINGSSFEGSSYSIDGNTSEAETMAAFMGGPGKGLIVQESFFEEGKGELAGIAGVSPDGHLFNEDGSSAGLVELKYLTNKSMKGAVKKYNKQMQMQMLVTGEERVNFYARSSDDNSFIHEVVEKDPILQQELKKKAIQIHKQASNMTPEEEAHLMHRMRPKKVKAQDQVTSAGQEAMYVPPEQEEIPIAQIYTPRTESGPSIRGNPMASPAATGGGSAGDGGSVTPSSNVGSSENVDELADSAKIAADNLDKFGKSVLNAVKNMAKLAGVAQEGNTSGMDEVRLAAATGLEVERVRGMRETMVESGLSESGATSVINAGGQLAQTLNNELTSGARWTQLLQDRAASNLSGVRSMVLPGYQEMQGMNPQQLVAMVQGQMTGKTMEERAQIGKIFGMQELSVSSATATEIGDVDGMIDESGLRAHQRGAQLVLQTEREAKEFAGSLGEVAGATSQGITASEKVLAGAAGLLGAGAIGKAALKVKGGGVNIGKNAGKVGQAAKTALTKIPKGGLVGAAAGLAPTAIRHAAGVEDDDSLADSGLDVLEMAAMGAGLGATVGSVFPVVGTAFGAGLGGTLGAGLGIANEVMEAFESPIPNKAITPMMNDIAAAAPVNVQNDVKVEVSVSEDLVSTSVDANGDISEDETNTLELGG